ncbi:MAG: hypothetical protein JRM80_02955 [Nitrososphaerota archaeon]|nr:hypothetical protein [Nitrososphaerota archaeon]
MRILWFKETSRWSRRGIPLRVVWVSPRQLAILLSSFLAGLIVATPLPTATLKLVPMGALLLVGFVIAFWRVKMLTPEQMIMVRLRGLTGISQHGEKTASLGKTAHVVEKPEESAFEIESDSAESFAPLSIAGKWKRTKYPVKVSLLVDGVPRPGAEALAIPGEKESSYTIVLQPTAADIGAHDLEVRVEGEENPIHRMKVDVKVKGVKSLEMRKVS